jgi:hypothetical protein
MGGAGEAASGGPQAVSATGRTRWGRRGRFETGLDVGRQGTQVRDLSKELPERDPDPEALVDHAAHLGEKQRVKAQLRKVLDASISVQGSPRRRTAALEAAS